MRALLWPGLFISRRVAACVCRVPVSVAAAVCPAPPELLSAQQGVRPSVLARPIYTSSHPKHGITSSTTSTMTRTTLSSPVMAHSSAKEEEPLSRSVQRLTDHLETPALDDRSYRVIRLGNQLEALLVHDPETDKASAAMDVNVGSFSDSDDMPGMAHAVEHLLFMGTEKVKHPICVRCAYS